MDSKVSLLMTFLLFVTQTHSLSNSNCSETLPDDSDSSHLYLLGGYDEKDSLIDSASRLNPITKEWTTMNNMPMERSLYCGAVVNKQIYLFGGRTPKANYSDSAQVYDCSTDTYTFLRPIPAQRTSCAAVALNDSVYLSGGVVNFITNGTGSTTTFDPKFYRYDIRTDQWSTLASGPTLTYRYGHQLVEVGGLLYAVGYTSSTRAYDPATNRWSIVADSNIYHSLASAAAHEGNIYILSAGGFEVYSPSTDKWTVLDAPAIVKNRGRSLVSMNGMLWAIGGETTGNGMNEKTVYTYDPNTDRWTKQRDLDTPRQFHGAFVVNH